MNNTWLILDCHYLCHRAFHTTRSLSHRGQKTGMLFGFFNTVTHLKDHFQTDRAVFCFESSQLKRSEIYPAYKKKRKKAVLTEEERISYQEFAVQLSQLKKRYLPKIGFENVLEVRGYESDDIMAVLARRLSKKGDEVVIVTADSDLWQCIDERVSVYSPSNKRLLELNDFQQEYGIPPSKWAVVKAITGCASDEVEGIKGVGEKTALKFLKGELSPGNKAYDKILSVEGKRIIRRNKELVRLPMEGCRVPPLREDNVTLSKWREVCDLLGMDSLRGTPPVASRKLIKRK